MEGNDEEPAEVEVKPILDNQVHISVFVEPPSSSEESIQLPVVQVEGVESAASFDERVVEGAEDDLIEVNSTLTGKFIDDRFLDIQQQLGLAAGHETNSSTTSDFGSVQRIFHRCCVEELFFF